MLSYLLHKPMEYSSHQFVPLYFELSFRSAMAEVYKHVGIAPVSSTASTREGNGDGDVKLRTRTYLNYLDYPFRPVALARFPYYFFHSSCELKNKLNSSSLDWVVLKDANGVERRQRSYRSTPMRSDKIPTMYLLDQQRRHIFGYDNYVHLRTDTPWRVPILYGKRPKLPDATATEQEKGLYALFLMLLFRPHTSIGELLKTSTTKGSSSSRSFADEDAAWRAIYEKNCAGDVSTSMP